MVTDKGSFGLFGGSNGWFYKGLDPPLAIGPIQEDIAVDRRKDPHFTGVRGQIPDRLQRKMIHLNIIDATIEGVAPDKHKPEPLVFQFLEGLPGQPCGGFVLRHAHFYLIGPIRPY